MANRKERQIEILMWYSAMVGAGRAMSDLDLRALNEWERENLDGCSVGTSDWPGWERLIGKRPVFTDDDRMKDCAGHVYLVRTKSSEYKIGRTQNIANRLRTIQSYSPYEIELVHKFEADNCNSAEALLKAKFEGVRLRGEWYLLSNVQVEAFCEIIAFRDGKFLKKIVLENSH